mgnify:CR=1 FL=1
MADSLREQDEKYTKAQTEKILAVADKCEAEGLHLEKVHFLNSAGGVYYYNERSSLARLGIILYGLILTLQRLCLLSQSLLWNLRRLLRR